MHGIFPTHNKYYLTQEIFPYLSKEEKKAVYFPEKKSKRASTTHNNGDEDNEQQFNKIKHKK